MIQRTAAVGHERSLAPRSDIEDSAIALLLVVAILAVGGYLLFLSLPDLCGNELIAESPSPDGKTKAVVFGRDCGATTNFATHVALLSPTETLDQSTVGIFSADTNHGAAPFGPGGGPAISIRWKSPLSLVVEHDPNVRVFSSAKTAGRVQIEYVNQVAVVDSSGSR